MLETQSHKDLAHEHSALMRYVIDNWRHIPLTLRQQYWRETDYGARYPSFELLVAMDAALLVALDAAIRTTDPHAG